MKYNYTEDELFRFMRKPARVVCKTGEVFEGKCWVYSRAYNYQADEIDEASVEIENITIFQSEIESIEFLN